MLDVELNGLLLREELYSFATPPNCDLPQLWFGFIFWCLSFFSFFDAVPLSFVAEALFFTFSGFFQRELFYM